MNPFLLCALAIPSSNFTRPTIVSYHAAKNEEDQVKDFIRDKDPYANVLITPKADPDRMKKEGWERVPFRWKDNEIWIQRKPRSDQKLGESA